MLFIVFFFVFVSGKSDVKSYLIVCKYKHSNETIIQEKIKLSGKPG